jgi:hypothetical protein
MIIKYREESDTEVIHSHKHNECDHELQDGWECTCSECQCATVVHVNAAYAYGEVENHGVIITMNPGSHLNRASGALTPNAARALAAALCFAANDAEQLNRDFS